MAEIQITIDTQVVDVTSVDEVPVSISYSLEDREDFQQKTAGQALNIVLPATLNNSQINNAFDDPSVEDLTSGKVFRNTRSCIIEANGNQLLVGKAILKSATHTHRPVSFSIDCHGDNGNWVIDLKDSTLYDFVKQISLPYAQSVISASWVFDGTDEQLPYVFAPVRYSRPMQEGPANYIQTNPPMIKDFNMTADYMRPSLSVYWIIYWGFKSLGYRVESGFFQTPYFRRMVMPWTWGNYLFSEGTLRDELKFYAKSLSNFVKSDTTMHEFIDLQVSNDYTDGGFDNGSLNGSAGNYSYSAADREGTFIYSPALTFGNINANLEMQINYDATASGGAGVFLQLYWYKTHAGIKTQIKAPEMILVLGSNAPQVKKSGVYTSNLSVDIQPGDKISFKVYADLNVSSRSTYNVSAGVTSFELLYTRIVEGTAINFSTFTAFKSHKFLDFLRGVIDTFNLSVNTDPINKVVLFEPTHAYSLTSDPTVLNPGYFNGDWLDWSDKMDVSKENVVELYSDGEREQVFKFKDDGSDGLLKVVQDRYSITLGSGKYVLPNRFQAGSSQVENRFFSPLMHYEVTQWRNITGTSTQMPIISTNQDVSGARDEPTFSPKIAYYKGRDNAQGWVFAGTIAAGFPFMFAVNYRPGGEYDPVLSYSDERTGNDTSGFALAKGLLRRFYWQRMAIMRGGQYYSPAYLRLRGIDVANTFHREYKILSGQKWELIQIKDYKPLLRESTACYLRKWAPVTQEDGDSTFPSQDSVFNGNATANPLDIKYNPLKCLTSDIR